MPLEPHQQEAIDKLKRNDSVLVYHGLGSGKTLTALAAAQQLGPHLNGPTSVIGPATLKGNFEKEKRKHKVKADFNYSTYTKPNLQNAGLLIFDEAHRMGREGTKVSQIPLQIPTEKTMLLTGTPIRNEPSELIPLLQALNVPTPKDKKAFERVFIEKEKVYPGFWGRLQGAEPGIVYKPKNLHLLTQSLRDRVDYHPSALKGFPTESSSDVYVPMSAAQEEVYQNIAKTDPGIAYKIKHGLPPGSKDSARWNAFLTRTRQASNNPEKFQAGSGAPKLDAALKDIQEAYSQDKNYRGVTYSNYLDSGVNPMASRLEALKIPYAKFTGDTPTALRDQAIKDYNEGKIKQLLISGAGSEGLDLKGTKLMQILEPHWNDQRLEQVRGRAVRFNSHAHLPENERVVNVKNYYSTLKDEPSTDMYLKQMSDRKTRLNNAFLKAIQDADTD